MFKNGFSRILILYERTGKVRAQTHVKLKLLDIWLFCMSQSCGITVDTAFSLEIPALTQSLLVLFFSWSYLKTLSLSKLHIVNTLHNKVAIFKQVVKSGL